MGILFEIVRHLSDSENYGKMIDAAERGDYALNLALQCGHEQVSFSEEKLIFSRMLPYYMYQQLLKIASNKYQSPEEFWANQSSWSSVNIVGDAVWYFTFPIEGKTQFIIKFLPLGQTEFQQLHYVKGELNVSPYPNLLVNYPPETLKLAVNQVYCEVFGFHQISDQIFNNVMGELAPILIYATEETVGNEYRDRKDWNQSKLYRIKQYDKVWLGVPYEDRLIAYPVEAEETLSSVTLHDQRGISHEQIFAKLLIVPRGMWNQNFGAAQLLRSIKLILDAEPHEPLDSIVRRAQVISKL